MSEEKKKKKAAIIAGIIGASTLVGGDIVGASTGIAETDAKVEENEEAKKNKPTGSEKKSPNTKIVYQRVDLATALPKNQRNLGTIATKGDILTADMIKVKLPANIQNEVDINIQGNKATLTAKTNSTLYKGSPITVNFNFDKKQDLAMALTKTKLSTIFENPLLLIHIFFGIIGFLFFCISLILILLDILRN